MPLSSTSQRAVLSDTISSGAVPCVHPHLSRLVRIGFHFVDLADKAQCFCRQPIVLIESVNELAARVCPAAIDGYIVILFGLVAGVITVTLDIAFAEGQERVIR